MYLRCGNKSSAIAENGAHGRGMAGREAGEARIHGKRMQRQIAELFEIHRPGASDAILQNVDDEGRRVRRNLMTMKAKQVQL